MLEDDERQSAVARLKERDAREREAVIEAEIEAERDRKARAAAEEAEKARQARVRAEISTEADKWQAALDEAEAGAVKMAIAIRAAFSAATNINHLMQSLGERSRIANVESAGRLGKRLSIVMSGLDQPGFFGHLVLDQFIMDAGASWKDGELKHAPWIRNIKGELK